MNLARISAAIRPRTAPEAMDLGVALARASFGAVFRPTAFLVAVVATAAFLLCEPAIAMLIVWWLKPLYDRVALFVLSRALFGAAPGFWTTLRHVPRTLSRGALFALTLGRFSPFRSFVLPVVALEEATGGDAVHRKRVLLDGVGGSAFGATLLCSILEQCLALGATMLVFWCTPGQGFEDLVRLFVPGRDATAVGAHPLALTGWLFALTLVEVIYVAAGFALYLNRRTWLEGWDVEIAFRSLAARAAGKPESTRRRATVGAVLLAGLLGVATPAKAQQSRPEEAIRKVLEDPAFSTKRRTTEWVRGDATSDTQRIPDGLASGIGGVFEFVLWGILAMGVVSLGIVVLRRRDARPARAKAPRAEPPGELFGLDLRKESLPDDPASVALASFDAGDARGALALLYRAALSHLANARDLAIVASDTEGDCVTRVHALAEPELASAFAALTRAWQSAAYAHAAPTRTEVADLCAAHARHFTVLP